MRSMIRCDSCKKKCMTAFGMVNDKGKAILLCSGCLAVCVESIFLVLNRSGYGSMRDLKTGLKRTLAQKQKVAKMKGVIK